MKYWNLLFLILIVMSCVQNPKQTGSEGFASQQLKTIELDYAEGFEIQKIQDHYILTIKEPWPDAENSFTYLLKTSKTELTQPLDYDYKIDIPLKTIVVTSTTHIPSLDTLGVLNKLLGFPNTNYISTMNAREMIDSGQIIDVGQNENLNTEVLINLDPDALVTFAVKGQNKGLENIKQAGIPVLYNADWVESHPLGKAEWIKFFGLLFDKTEQANRIFQGIKDEYEKAKKLASEVKNKPDVISGALWKDQWYLPAGDSWQAKIINDAHANYLYAESEGSGSLSLSFESVLNHAHKAEYWVAPAQYTSYTQMLEQQPHYSKFKSFQEKNIFGFSSITGKNGGILYYELAPNRPDWVLKDMINIFHPNVLSNYENHFFKPLNP